MKHVDVLLLGGNLAARVASKLQVRFMGALSLKLHLMPSHDVSKRMHIGLGFRHASIMSVAQKFVPSYVACSDIPVRKIDPQASQVTLASGEKIAYRILVYAGRQPRWPHPITAEQVDSPNYSIFSNSCPSPAALAKFQDLKRVSCRGQKIGFYLCDKPFTGLQEVNILPLVKSWRAQTGPGPASIQVLLEGDSIFPGYPKVEQDYQTQLAQHQIKVQRKVALQSEFDWLFVRAGVQHPLLQGVGEQFNSRTLQHKKWNNLFMPGFESLCENQDKHDAQLVEQNVARLVSGCKLRESTGKTHEFLVQTGEGVSTCGAGGIKRGLSRVRGWGWRLMALA